MCLFCYPHPQRPLPGYQLTVGGLQHQMEWHAESVLYNKDNSVYAPSIIPNFPLTEWNEDLTDDLVEEGAFRCRVSRMALWERWLIF